MPPSPMTTTHYFVIVIIILFLQYIFKISPDIWYHHDNYSTTLLLSQSLLRFNIFVVDHDLMFTTRLITSCHLCSVPLYPFAHLLTKCKFRCSISSIMVSSPSPFIYPGDESLNDYPSSPTPSSPPSSILHHGPSPSPLLFTSINVVLRFSPPVPPSETLANTPTVKTSSSATISTTAKVGSHLSSVNLPSLTLDLSCQRKCQPKRRSSKNGEVSSH